MCPNIIKPKPLKRGDTIGIVTCSSPEPNCHKERFNKGLNVLKELGFKIVIGENAFKKRAYMAGTGRERARDINKMFEDPNINAIICAGGGVSANRVIPYIDFDLIKKKPKIFMGISNPAILLNAIFSKTGLITFHGPTIIWDFGSEKGLNQYTKEYLFRSLTDTNAIGRITPSSEWKVFKDGKRKGLLMGGHLTTIQSILGTVYSPDWKNSIFFWEEVNKEPHVIDAMLTHFKLAGVFDKISGMIIGEIVNCEEKKYPETLKIEEIIEDICGDYDFPILYGVKLGHTVEKITIPIGVTATLELHNGEINFSIDESGVI